MNKIFNRLITLEARYEISGEVYTQSGFHGEHFDVKIVSVENIASIKIISKTNSPIKLISFKIDFAYEFSKNCRIFLNGYQAWTACREYSTGERMEGLTKLGKIGSKVLGFAAYGDYDFKAYPEKEGVFHGYSYAYIRQGENYCLFGSLTERHGFTVFNFDCDKNRIIIEKDVEGAEFTECYNIFDLFNISGKEDYVFDEYFSAMKIQKPREKHRCGYTTWYNYYQNINEKIVDSDLDALCETGEKIDIFQIDDGYQTAVGDWLSIDKKKFPNGMKAIADKIHEKGMLAGIWLAPLGCQKNSKTATEHPDWFIKDKTGKPLRSGMNWGGFYTLDISNKAAADYVRHCFDVILNEWGYDLVKLDFLYGACITPYGGKTRGQLMCEAMDFLCECVGDKLILGCGVPLAPAYGKVDFCRTGADMGLIWKRTFRSKNAHKEDVCTESAVMNTVFRRQLDGRAFCNDPDVCLLRDYNIKMDFEQRKLVTKINKLFGNLIFISDNVKKYNKEQSDAFKYAFRPSDIKIISAEYIRKNIIEVVYEENSVRQTMTFDISTGAVIE